MDGQRLRRARVDQARVELSGAPILAAAEELAALFETARGAA